MTKKRKEKDWFRPKKYPHIGLPIENEDRKWIEPYVKDVELISKHAFLPLIHKSISTRKFRRKRLDDGSKSEKRVPSYKDRDIYYASHLDACIYSYFSELLNESYEEYISGKDFGTAITAYRKIKLNPLSKESRNKCNIDFAKDVFDYIKTNKDQELVAITFDITSFFDNLDHKLLKNMWMKALGEEKALPKNHYNVFRNLTKFSFVEIDDLFDEFKNDILVKDKADKIVRLSVPRLDLLKEKNAIAFCEDEAEFNIRIRKKNLIKSNKWTYKEGIKKLRIKGIPQGSPISAILANIYMLDFDSQMYDFITAKNGVYQRYSDDMVVVASLEDKDDIIAKFYSEISNYKLDIQPSKTQVFAFKEYDRVFGCKELDLNGVKPPVYNKFDYLGFSFDGDKVYLKSSGLAKYYRKMKRGFRRGAFYAKYGKNEQPRIFKNRLYKRFTHLGSERRTIYMKDPKNPDEWIPSNKYDWGNFLTYVNLAQNVFGGDTIKHQTKNSWKIFHELMNKKELEIKKFYDKKKNKN